MGFFNLSSTDHQALKIGVDDLLMPAKFAFEELFKLMVTGLSQ
jgi:hypothetical protein